MNLFLSSVRQVISKIPSFSHKKILVFPLALLGVILVIYTASQTVIYAAQEQQDANGVKLNGQDVSFTSNELLIKVKKGKKALIREDFQNPGIDSLKNVFKKHKINKFQKVFNTHKNNNKQQELDAWYKITLDGESRVVKGMINSQNKQLKSQDTGVVTLQKLMRDLGNDQNIETVEPNYMLSSMQTSEVTEDTICQRGSPTVVTSPKTVNGTPGQQFDFTITITNTDSSACGASNYYAYSTVPSGWSVTSGSSLSLNPGESRTFPTFTVASPANAAIATYKYYGTGMNLSDTSYNNTSAADIIITSEVTTPTPTPTSTDTTPPTAPSNLTATQVTSTTISLSWGASSDNVDTSVGTYEVYRNGTNIIMGNIRTYLNKNLTPNTTYTYYVRSRDRAGNWSEPSNEVTVTTLSAPSPFPISEFEPNDPYYASVDSYGQSYADMWGLRKIDMAQAWQQTTGSNQIVVASIDTGVDYNHPDITDNIWVNSYEIPDNGIDDDGNGYIDDYHGWDFLNNDNNPIDDNGHGTHTAGTIAASTNNGLGVAGVSWNSKIMSLKFLGSNAQGPSDKGAQALIYAADMGADISSNSWGCTCQSSVVDDAVRYAHDRGVTVVVSSGNNNSDALDNTPASSQYAITVGATDIDDLRSDFGFGNMSNWGEKIDVVAPGSFILSLKSAAGYSCSSSVVGTEYCTNSGTSMAAPHVSGLAALLLSKDLTLTNEQIRQILRSSAVDLGAAGKDSDFGYGRINAGQAVQEASISGITAFINEPISRIVVANDAPFTISGTASGPGFSRYVIETGVGRSPTTWNTLVDTTDSVTDGVLANVNPNQFLETGLNTIRLTVYDTENKFYQSQVFDLSFTLAPSPTVTMTPTPTSTPTNTPVPSPTPTNTPSPTPTPVPVYTLSGIVYMDSNMNGVQDNGEDGYTGAQISINSPEQSTMSDNTGAYRFDQLRDGVYTVSVREPAGYTVTTTNPVTVTLSDSTVVNFGITIIPTSTPTLTPTNIPSPTPTATPLPTNTPTPTPIPTYTLSGTVYKDMNANGVQDSGELGYSGANISLSSGVSTTTNESGGYTFSNIVGATYTVTLSVPTAYFATTANPVNIPLSSNTTLHFGIAPVPTNTPTATFTPTPTSQDTTPPVITITNPTDNESVSKNSTVTIAAHSSDSSGVAKVEFYVDGSLVCTDTSSAYSCNWRVGKKPRITYSLQARSYDMKGNTATYTIQVISQ